VPDDQLADIAAARVFGPRPGEYGTRTTTLIETGAWENEEQLAETFTASMNHLYGDGIHGVRQTDAFRRRLETVDLVSQVRDSHEYEIADLDHYYEFFGGLARTVEAVRGSAPAMLISDTTKEVIRTETVGDALHRGVRTRLLNPKWIDGMLAHDYHGAQEIAERVQYLIGFASTTHAVDDWVFSAVHERFVADDEMYRRLAENNRFATEEIMKRLFEAHRRGYWNASDEELEALRNRYLQLESMIEETIQP
jgi:cobaltochelatase CobN